MLRTLNGVTPQQARIPMVSAMTGQQLEGPELDASYWYDSLRAPVQFNSALATLAGEGHQAFIEVSPHPVLTVAITETLGELDAAEADLAPVVTGTLRRDDGGADRLLTSFAEAHVHGISIDWTEILPAGQLAELPTYAFQRQRYWPAPAPVVAEGGAQSAAEARFWAAVEQTDAPQVAALLGISPGLDGPDSPDGLDGGAAGRAGRLAEVLPALAAWRRRERDEAVTGSWRYRVTWVPAPAPAPAPGGAGLAGTWLMITPEDGHPVVAGIAAAVAARGGHVRVVSPAGLDRAAVADAVSGAATAAATGAGPGGPVVGVISLLAVPGPGLGSPDGVGDEDGAVTSRRVPAGTAGTLALVQALGDAEVDAPLWVLTRGAVATTAGDQLADPVQAQVWGLGRVAALEYPGRWGGLIDLSPVRDETGPAGPAEALDARAVGQLCSVLTGATEESEIAIRPAGVLTRRLARAPRPAPGQGPGWRPSGTMLVTGGTGAIGSRVARWLAGQGADRLILASRSGPAAAGAAALAAAVAGSGAAVTVVAADVSDRYKAAALLTWTDLSGPVLRGVFHTAGVLDDGVLDRLDEDRLAGVLGPKAGAAAVLDELTAGRDLDAFVLFSSAAATFGSAGQGNYAAANAYLDALAEHRRGRG
ncbi:MAG TPA: SDR family NAD(P)-dependent oxidoreductase, partial [Streptosporangiaceae bacterium]